MIHFSVFCIIFIADPILDSVVTLGQLATADSPSLGKVVSSLANISDSVSSDEIVESVDRAVKTLVEFSVFAKQILHVNFTQENTTLIKSKHWAGELYPDTEIVKMPLFNRASCMFGCLFAPLNLSLHSPPLQHTCSAHFFAKFAY